MDDSTRRSPTAASRRPHADEIADQLLQALTARAERLGLDPTSIRTVGPGSLIARAADGGLLRLDFRAYQRDELAR